MPLPVPDLASVRFQNAQSLFEEFVRAAAAEPDAAVLRGLEGRFAERLQIQPSYWSQIKGRSRQIGERLARQFEQTCGKPNGWMDQVHGASASASALSLSRANTATAGHQAQPSTQAATSASSDATQPRDDDERFILSLVLGYYRRDPRRARARLLDLLGEVLNPVEPKKVKPPAAAPAAVDADLWQRVQKGVAPLKKKP